MKKIIIICMLVAGFSTVKAQTNQDAPVASSETMKSTDESEAPKKDDPFWNTTISVSNNMVTLANLPAGMDKVKAIITTNDGDFVKQMKVSPEANAIDISKVHAGMYFVTLTCHNKSMKAFVIHI